VAAQVAGGDLHTCTRFTNGTVRCWGYNGQGALGNGTSANSSVPVVVSGVSTAIDLDAAHRTSCAVLANRTVQCWGYNPWGNFGDGTTTTRYAPATIATGITTAAEVAVAYHHTCVRLTDGTVRCFGHNGNGNLGRGFFSGDYPSPAAVTGLSGVVQISAGYQHTCAVLSSGGVRCWGWNAYGQLGNGATGSAATPVAVTGITNAVEVECGYYHTCARLSDNTVRCWGYNGYGQLGNGSTSTSYTPVAVTGITTASRLAGGQISTCALLGDGSMRCWGYNGNGELSNNTTATSSTPVAAVLLTGGTMCGAVAGTPTTESCNGIDDDCDGIVDEEATRSCYTGAATTRGVGACRDGVQTCNVGGAGTWGACVGEVLPSTESCNGVDDNCNNAVDESLTRSCYTGPGGTLGVGTCRGGTQTCSSGTWGACVGEVLPITERCNSVDDDCDTVVDETYRTLSAFGGASATNNAVCGSGCATTNPITGACSCPSGYASSTFYALNDCNASLPLATHSVCRTATRDTDDGYAGTYQLYDTVGGSYGCRTPNPYTGTCSCPAGTLAINTRVIALGTTSARIGTVVTWCVKTTARPRSFGGVYQIDDPVPGNAGCRAPNPLTGACSCPTGTVAQTYRTIVDGSSGLIGSRVIVCTDTYGDVLGTACAVGVGACRRTGTNVCSTDQTDTVCSVSPGSATAETCNGIDDNCNGVVDEGVTQSCYGGPAGTLNVGTCRAGSQTCVVGGTGTWGACTGDVRPVTETCNGLDDDCNGAVDNGSATTCTAPISIGTLNPSGAFTLTGYVAAPAGSEQWYVVSVPTSFVSGTMRGTGTPTINLTGAGSLRMDVRYGSCAGALSCTAGTQWSFTDNTAGTAFRTRSVAWPTTVYVRVYRTTATTTCGAYTLTVTRP
jgi:hypothetical protein